MLNQMSTVREVKGVVEEIYPKIVALQKESSEAKKDMQDFKSKLKTLTTNETKSSTLLTQIRTRLSATTNLVTEPLKVRIPLE